jgi:ubiquinol-cytochrome c reductase cytochrome b subunit
VAAIAFYSMLFVGAGTDVIAVTLHVSENAIIWFVRVTTLTLPVVSGLVAYRLCKELAAVPDAGRRHRAEVIVRGPTGGYESASPPVETVRSGTAAPSSD